MGGGVNFNAEKKLSRGGGSGFEGTSPIKSALCKFLQLLHGPR